MADIPHPDDLVLPPGQPVPPPQPPDPETGTTWAIGDPGLDQVLLREVQQLADRVGGLQRLKEVTEALILLRRRVQ